MVAPIELVSRLAQVVGDDQVLTSSEELAGYSGDETAATNLRRIPLLVVRPGSDRDVVELMRLFHAERVPVTVRGGGTGLAAACVPSPGAVVLSMERLNRVIEVDEANATIRVQAGTTLRQVYEAVEGTDLCFPPHPGAENAHIGGTVATNAGGARAVKYGTIKRFVLGLKVVLADGTLLELGGKLVKSSTGYHLAELMIGSEGTLGVVTEVTLALLPRPAASITMVASFADVGSAIGAVPPLLRLGIIPTAAEFVEHSVLRCAERMLRRSWPAANGAASLMLVLDGASDAEVMHHAEVFGEHLDSMGACDVVVADSEAKQREVLELRSVIYEALRPGTIEIFDITLPRSEVPGHVERVHRLARETDMPLPTYGHAGDGNVHTHAMRRRMDDGELTDEVPDWNATHARVRDALYADALARGGTISGEHGIGLVKRSFLPDCVGPEALDVMRRIKRALDPENILNPGKVFALAPEDPQEKH